MKYLAKLSLGIVFSVTFVAGSRNPAFSWDTTRNLLAFGDSYTFVQGSHGFANFSFIGDELDLQFTPRELLSNEIIPKNTSSDGSNWAEFLTGCFSGRPSLCSRQLWNFAFAGADIDGTLLPLHHNFTIPLIDQVKQWATYAADLIPNPREESLAAWWIGINDTGDTANNKTIIDFEEFWTTEMKSYFQAVETVYAKGLRNFLFINVPPGNRAPARVNDPVGGPILKKNIILFNNVLDTFITDFSSAHPDANVFSFDAYSWFNTILDNAAEFGFTNITGFCTCTDDTFFWYNTGQYVIDTMSFGTSLKLGFFSPTERVHSLLAEAIKTQLEGGTAS